LEFGLFNGLQPSSLKKLLSNGRPAGFLAPRRQSLNRAPHGPHRDQPSRFRRHTATLPPGSTGYENAVNEKGQRLIWIERRMLDKLNSYRRAGESYSDVILRLAAEG
jgi:hypothetical protein